MKVTLKEWLAQTGYATANEALAEYTEMDDTFPAMCSEGCCVELVGQRPPRRFVPASGSRAHLTGGNL